MISDAETVTAGGSNAAHEASGGSDAAAEALGTSHAASEATGRSAAYRPLDGVPDEFCDAEGRISPLWQALAAHLDSLDEAGLAEHISKAEQYLNDSGVFYRQYGTGDSVERPWPFSPVPVLIAEEDWRGLESALIQRADLLEAVMADLYGENRLVAEGKLPAALIAASPEWLRPMVGIKPASGHYLNFLAFELGRGPDGKWWVLADRAQAPSGAGYALENRVATSRAFPDLFTAQNVHRLAGFFRSFRDALLDQRPSGESRVSILTPGPLNETYYEHAYIARYLGFNLVEGEDLQVVNGQLMMRTVSGLRPAEVVWRRLDSTYADPLELDPQSRIGTPGLVSALRSGGAMMVNALGSGVLETRALMAFLPRLAPEILGAPLEMPNIATWWCGDPKAREEVLRELLARPGRLTFSPANATGMPFAQRPRLAPDQPASPPPDPEALAARIEREAGSLVAQEAVTLSTTPTLENGKLVPRPMALRVFLARTKNGWEVMPGGFARIGASPDPEAVNMQSGGAAADVWVVSPAPVPPLSNLTDSAGQTRSAGQNALPSRAADNLFWLGRYIERTEAMVRLMRAVNTRVAETGRADTPLLLAIGPLFESLGLIPPRDPDATEPALPPLPADPVPAMILQTLGNAIGSAGRIRDRFAPDAWWALHDISRTARRMAERVRPGDDAADAHSKLLRKLAGITGLVHENMYRNLGWRFLTLGRLQERSMNMAAMLALLTAEGMPEGALDLAIELGDSALTHRRRFSVTTARGTVLELLALDPLNPRALRYQIEGIRDQISTLPGMSERDRLPDLARAALRLSSDLTTAETQDLTPEVLWALWSRIGGISDLLTRRFFA